MRMCNDRQSQTDNNAIRFTNFKYQSRWTERESKSKASFEKKKQGKILNADSTNTDKAKKGPFVSTILPSRK